MSLVFWQDPVKAYQFFSLSRKGGLVILGIYLANADWGLDEIGYWEALLFSITLLGSFWLEAWLKVYLSSANAHDPGHPSIFRWIVRRVFFFTLAVISCWYLLEDFLSSWLIPEVPGHWTNVFLVFSFFWLPSLILPSYYLLNRRSTSLWMTGIFYLIGFPLFFILGDLLLPDNVHPIWALVIWVLPLAYLTLKVYEGEGHRSVVGSEYGHVLTNKWNSLVIYSLMAVAAPLFDTWLVQWWYPEPDTFAIFRYGARELPLASTLTAALSSAMIPLLSDNRMEGLFSLHQRILRISWVLFPLVIGLMLFSRGLFVFFFTDQFIESARLFDIYLLLTITQLLIVQPILIVNNRERWLVYAAVLELGMNILLSIVLGYFWEIPGIAIATVLAFAVEKIFLIHLIASRLGISVKRYIPYSVMIWSIVLLGIWICKILLV